MSGRPDYRYSFSGADARAFVFFPDYSSSLAPLESLHTISISVHESKGQARALGHRGIRGFSRGVRTIAGSMVLTVVEDHPMRELLAAAEDARIATNFNGGWSVDRKTRGVGTALDSYNFVNELVTLLPPFNLLCQYVSEGAAFSTQTDTLAADDFDLTTTGAAWMLEEIEIIDYGLVTSVNDVVSEVTISFLALDYKDISKMDFTGSVQESFVRSNLRDLEKEHVDVMNRLYPSTTPATSFGDYDPDPSESKLV